MCDNKETIRQMRHLGGAACAHQHLSGHCCLNWGWGAGDGGGLEPPDPHVWVCALCLQGRPPHPCPQPPWLGRGCLEFRVSLPGGFPFVSPPAHRGSWGPQGEIYPGKRKISLSLGECVSVPCLAQSHTRGAGLGVGWAACPRLGKACFGGGGARAAGPGGIQEAQLEGRMPRWVG